jgi:SAM-dependent methyltransferase
MVQDSSEPEFWNTRYRDHVTPWDFGGVPADLRAFAGTLSDKTRILVPGCGSGHEVVFLAESGLDVLAIDFSAQAIELARQRVGPFADRVRLADFFVFDPGSDPFEVVYERAFLCALPRQLWSRYGERMAVLLPPERRLAGFFYYGDNPRGPPFGTSPAELHGLLDGAFELIEDRPATDSLPVFQAGERWQVWRRRVDAGARPSALDAGQRAAGRAGGTA